ncbi:MAG: response regulator transcription factor [Balneolaceae bacterium]|nr:response regulator transcription factor [Balneolaceae bacterium]
MINYLIIDDEYVAHDIIKGYCDLLPNMQLAKSCYDALEAIEYLNQHAVDLIFLDLNMPTLKGFEFLRTLQNPPKVIVTTAYQEYALEGYELNVVDYLLKPFSFERFLKAVNKTTLNVPKPNPTSTPETTQASRTIFLRQDKRFIQIELDSIQYLEASGNYTKVITTAQTISVREKISELLDEFSSDDFLQVHRSFAVSKSHISSIVGNRIFIGETQIPIGKMFKANVDGIVGG